MPLETSTPLSRRIADALDCRPQAGIYRVSREIFRDPELFELEMGQIFERTWVFACHESQVANENDFFALRVGRQPVVLTRDRQGRLHALINSCLHRGATLVRKTAGNARALTCSYHAWTYRNDGQLIGVKEPASYNGDFKIGEKCLKKGRVESYRGFVFVNLDLSAPLTLEAFLGETRRIIDLIVDQSEAADLEVVPGRSVYTYDGNWKLQTENGVDGYHVTTVHSSWVATLANRWRLDQANAKEPDGLDATRIASLPPGSNGWFAFEHGHTVLFSDIPNPTTRAGYADIYPRLQATHGDQFAHWSMAKARNLNIYPSLLLMDQISTQICVIRPVAWNKTELHSYCLGVKGEAPETREKRIRQFEDFFNVSGMGTPDDLVEFVEEQRGFEARSEPWSDLSRGHRSWAVPPTPASEALGIRPALIGTEWPYEGLFVHQYRTWQAMLLAGLEERDMTGSTERAIEQFLFRKAELCDRRDWDSYLELFDGGCEFHVPQWLSDAEYATDPKTQMSYIYWKDRSGLEDRIFRLRTGRSAAYRPPFRTLHTISNIRPSEAGSGDWAVKANWCTHLYRLGKSDMLFGWAEYLLSPSGPGWKVRRKHAVILNDVINLALDFYHL